ncbi:hypothetical protein NMY22_g13638 [Coprinellus aureogranulatus]|nr:hypothetical protein NMY22_g13638 [Coprinellus aureogranulatus]
MAHDSKRSCGIPSVILRASLRLLFLRFVLASSFVCAVYSIWALLSLSFDKTVAASVAFTIFTFGHHIANALGPRAVRISTALDLLITLCEIGCKAAFCSNTISLRLTASVYLFVLTLPRVWGYTARSKWFPKRAVIALLCAWLLALSLVGLFILKSLHIFRARKWTKMLSSKVDVAKSTDDPDGVDSNKLPIWKYFFKAVFGRKIWEQRIPGEGRWIVVLRGVLAFMIIVTLVIYGFYETMLMPISEMGMMPNKEFRASAIPSTFVSSAPLAWNLIVVRHLSIMRQLGVCQHRSSFAGVAKAPRSGQNGSSTSRL